MRVEPKEGSVQLHSAEDVWVRTDRGVTNMRWLRAVAIHRVATGVMVFGHSGGAPAGKAIPLAKCATQEDAQLVIDALADLVGALDLRPFEGEAASDEPEREASSA